MKRFGLFVLTFYLAGCTSAPYKYDARATTASRQSPRAAGPCNYIHDESVKDSIRRWAKWSRQIAAGDHSIKATLSCELHAAEYWTYQPGLFNP